MLTLMTEMTAMLAEHIRKHGPVKAVRVSSACASGRAKQYAYWGVARYEIRLTNNGMPASFCTSRAPSARRSKRLAQEDARLISDMERRVIISRIGTLDEYECENVLVQMLRMGLLPPAAKDVLDVINVIKALSHAAE